MRTPLAAQSTRTVHAGREREVMDMRNQITTARGSRRLLLPIALAVLAMLALACQPVAPYGQGSYLNPIGVLDSVTAVPGGVRMTGWAAEFAGQPSEWRLHGPEPTRIVAMVNGEWVTGVFMADKQRLDVDGMFVANPIWDANHTYLPYRRPGAPYGFDFEVKADPGEVTICVVALNTMWRMAEPANFDFGGDHSLLGCRTVTVP